jgi:hypothetical protein
VNLYTMPIFRKNIVRYTFFYHGQSERISSKKPSSSPPKWQQCCWQSQLAGLGVVTLQHFFFVITGAYDIIEGELEKIFYSRTAHHARI